MRTVEHDGFRDDGGTPAWRANQATWNRTTERDTFRARLNRLTLADWLGIFICLVAGPWVLLFLTLVVLAVWDALVG